MYLPNPFHNFVHAVDVLCWLTMDMEKVEVGILPSEAQGFDDSWTVALQI